ncbi:MAG: protein kinase domain-containing protein [Nitrosopumilaceae archaeon]
MTLNVHMVIKGKSDNYTAIKKITQGGMAEIWSGTDSRGREVILKSPRINGGNPYLLCLDKLKVEAEILRELSNPGHPNLVRYIDDSAQNNSFYLVLEKINGKSLKEMAENNPVPERDAIKYLVAILDVVKYVHTKGVVHRDITPHNILLDPIRGPVLIDFGTAKHGYTQMSAAGSETIVGKMNWSCPHQFQGQSNSSCDIYSVGTVMFYLLTGKEPKFFMNTRGQLTKKPDDVKGGVSSTISNIVNSTIDPDHKTITTADDITSYLQKGSYSSYGRPHIILQGVKHEILGETDIGRQHSVCDANCSNLGYNNPPKISLVEGGQNFISKHHLRIWMDKQGYYWIQDLRSRNGTAVFKSSSYRLLSPGQKEMLIDNSAVAICYNPNKGPYLTFTFHER